MRQISLHAKFTTIQYALPTSKSEANRLLILQVQAGGEFKIENLSTSRDTQLLRKALSLLLDEGKQTHTILDLQDAGTAVRFITAFAALRGHTCTIIGSERMMERPIGPLVDALRQLGCRIDYTGEEGYLPLSIRSSAQHQANVITVRADISSQYISALLLVAPSLPEGLRIRLVGQISSRPYIDMTLALLRRTGIVAGWEGEDTVYVRAGLPAPGTYTIEPDWSAAGYAYALCGLLGQAIYLPNLQLYSLQGDAVVARLMADLGVHTHATAEGLTLRPVAVARHEIRIDFTPCPDLAQTLIVYCAAKRIRLTATGLHSLRIKETDRIAALQQELAVFGCGLDEVEPGAFVTTGQMHAPTRPVATYGDHRMAMAFSVLGALYPIEIETPEVVAKSFPDYWQQLAPLMQG